MPDNATMRFAHRLQMNAQESGEADLLLYSEIVPSGWKWNSDDRCAADLDREIRQARKDGASKLHLRINSPGGDVLEAAAMRSIIIQAGFDNVRVTIEGLCASAATMVACLPGAKVTMGRASEYMIHNPWTTTRGTAKDHEHNAERLRNTEKVMRGLYHDRTGIEDEKLQAMMDEETWMTAEQAVEQGFADDLLEMSEDGETPIAACPMLKPQMLEAMRMMYKAVPDNLLAEEEQNDGNVTEGVAPSATPEHKGDEEVYQMDIKDMNAEQLLESNKALHDSIAQRAVQAERERLANIDAMTPMGYEEMAAKAKTDGTSLEDYLRMLVSAQHKKGEDFIQNRAKETAPAGSVSGSEPKDKRDDEAADMAAYQKEMQAMFASMDGKQTGEMF